jgi:hypothetical protein
MPMTATAVRRAGGGAECQRHDLDEYHLANTNEPYRLQDDDQCALLYDNAEAVWFNDGVSLSINGTLMPRTEAQPILPATGMTQRAAIRMPMGQAAEWRGTGRRYISQRSA